MNIPKLMLYSVLFCLLFQISACSKKEKTVSQPAQAPGKALINVVYDAVRFYGNGGQTFQAPPGTTIEKNIQNQDEGGKLTEYVEIGGMQQNEKSVAVILFRFPAAWLSTEKQKLGSLETEMKDLTACAEKLRDKERKGANLRSGVNDSCKMLEITANSRPGITIRDDKVKHIEMLIYALD